MVAAGFGGGNVALSKEHIYLFGHLVGVFLLVGAAGFSTVAGILTSRSTNLKLSVLVLDMQRRTELFVTSVGALITIVFGSLLVTPAHHKMADAWISAAFALMIVVLALDHGVLLRANRKARALAADLLAKGTNESSEPAAIVGAPLVKAVGILLDLSFVAFLWLMVYRPGS
jgi:uncharacterized membrane protein